MTQVADIRDAGSVLNYLNEMRNFGGPAVTTGLTDDVISEFLVDSPALARSDRTRVRGVRRLQGFTS